MLGESRREGLEGRRLGHGQRDEGVPRSYNDGLRLSRACGAFGVERVVPVDTHVLTEVVVSTEVFAAVLVRTLVRYRKWVRQSYGRGRQVQ